MTAVTTGATTGAAVVRAVSAAGEAGEFPHVLAGMLLRGPAARLAGLLDPAFLTEAGWDPVTRVLSLPARHRLLGRTLCRVDGCPATAHGTKTGGLCWRCWARLSRAGMSAEQIGSAVALPALAARPPGCLVPGCQRMSPGGRARQRSGLCRAHSRRWRRTPGTPIEQFLTDPNLAPLPRWARARWPPAPDGPRAKQAIAPPTTCGGAPRSRPTRGSTGGTGGGPSRR